MVCSIDPLIESVHDVFSLAILTGPVVISKETENASCVFPLEIWSDSYGCLQMIVPFETLLGILNDDFC